jgi:hypothetical protein
MILKQIESGRDDVMVRTMLAILVGKSEPSRDMRFLELDFQAIKPTGQLAGNADHSIVFCHRSPPGLGPHLGQLATGLRRRPLTLCDRPTADARPGLGLADADGPGLAGFGEPLKEPL